MNTLMHIDEQRIADVTVLRLSGRLELYDGDVVLKDRVDGLVDEGRVNLVLDMKDVTRVLGPTAHPLRKPVDMDELEALVERLAR